MTSFAENDHNHVIMMCTVKPSTHLSLLVSHFYVCPAHGLLNTLITLLQNSVKCSRVLFQGDFSFTQSCLMLHLTVSSQ